MKDIKDNDSVSTETSKNIPIQDRSIMDRIKDFLLEDKLRFYSPS